MNRSEIFSAAHKFAKNTKNTGMFTSMSYAQRFSEGLRAAYASAKFPTPETIAQRVKAANAAVSTFVEGAMISGCYRGKKSESYKYCTTSRTFIYNNAGRFVSEAFAKALSI